MAIDPRIALGVTPPQQPDFGATIGNVARGADALAQVKQRIEAAKVPAQIDQALKDSNGDWDAAIALLDQRGFSSASSTASAAKDQRDKAIDAHMKASLDSHEAQLKIYAQIANSMTDPASYAAGKGILKQIAQGDPTVDQFYPDNPDPKDIPGIVQKAQAASMPYADYLKNAQAAEDKWLSGDRRGAVAQALTAAMTSGGPDAYQAELQRWQQRGGQLAVAPFVGLTPADFAADPDVALKRAVTPNEKLLRDEAKIKDTNIAANQTADNARADAQMAATEAFRQQQLKIQQQNADAATFRAHNPATAGQTQTTEDDASAIAQAIADGKQPPVTTGLYRLAGPVRAELAKKGYDLSKANEDWTATQKYLATLNGQQQTRLRQAVDFASGSLDLVDQLAQQWDGSVLKPLNAASLATAKQGVLGQQAKSLAVRLDAQIADLQSELGTVYKGGNSSTDESLKLAAKNLQADWDAKTLKDATNQIRQNLSIRQNSMRLSGGAAGTSPGNQYAPAGSPLDVTDPNGKIHHFETPAQAQAFRDAIKKAGGGD